MGEHLANVKAYITKFDLERELSNAVNLAIKEDAPDPYRVIIDYLKDLTQVRPTPTDSYHQTLVVRIHTPSP